GSGRNRRISARRGCLQPKVFRGLSMSRKRGSIAVEGGWESRVPQRGFTSVSDRDTLCGALNEVKELYRKARSTGSRSVQREKQWLKKACRRKSAGLGHQEFRSPTT